MQKSSLLGTDPDHLASRDAAETPSSYVAKATQDLECPPPRRPRHPHPPAPSGLDLERALTTRETGGILGQSEITLQQWRAQARGPRFFRIGGGKRQAVRYRLGDVLAFRDANMVGKAP